MRKNLLLLTCLFTLTNAIKAQSCDATTTQPSIEPTNKRVIIDNIETKVPEKTPVLEQTAPLNAVVRKSANFEQEAKVEKGGVKIEK